MHDWVPDRLKLADEVSAARWIEERLWPWERDGVLVGSFMPDIFESYARVFHPAYQDDGSVVRWSELARRRGIELMGDTTFRDVGGGLRSKGIKGEVQSPPEGVLPPEVLLTLAGSLRAHTSTADQCWFCFWEGDGALWSESHGWLRREGDSESKEMMEAARRQDEVWNAAPKVRAPGRNYLLFSGPLSVVEDLTDAFNGPELNMWWPDDRAWLVSTEVDAITSYVGGSQEAIEGLFTDPELDAAKVDIQSRLDPRG